MQINLEGENKLYKTKECVKELIEKIKGNESTILEINFTGNVFYTEPLDYLFEHISKIEKLQKCILVGVLATLPKDVMISNLKIISKKLPTKHLEVLNLSDNALSCELPQEFRDFFHSLDKLRILQLNNCGLGKIGGSWLADTLLGMKNRVNLKVIELAQNKFQTFPKNLGTALQYHTGLEEIKIQYNTIGKEHMDDFISSFEDLKLKVLDIRDNELSLKGCEMLGKFFMNWEIEELYIGDCLMSNEGFELFLSFASQKEETPILHGSFIEPKQKFILDVSSNEIKQSGVEALVKFCKDRHVDKLFIQGNEYDDCYELVNLIGKKGGKVIHDY